MFIDKIFTPEEKLDNEIRLRKAIDFIKWNKELEKNLAKQRAREQHIHLFY